MKKLPASILAITAISALAAGIWLGQFSTSTDEPEIKPALIQGAIYPQAKVIKDFELRNQRKQKITKADFLHQWSLIFVGYTHCPDICPTTLTVMSQVVDYLKEQQIEPPQIVFLSVDPERDTVEVIKPYIEYFNKDFIGLTGSIEQISGLAQQLNAVFRKAPGSDGQITSDNYLMDHSSALMLLNPQGNLQTILTAPHMPGAIIESILQTQAYYEAITDINDVQ